MQDLKYALRWLRRSPGFTAAAVASLAIGIGFNTALFSVVDAVLFRPLPVRAPDELVNVYTSGSDGEPWNTTSYPDFLDLREQNGIFTDVLGYSPMFAAVSRGDRTRLAMGEIVTANYFQMLGVHAALGRTLVPDDDGRAAERVIVISHRYWTRELGRDPAVLGRQLQLRGQSYTIVGVIDPDFTGMTPMLSPDLWVPVREVGEIEPAGIQDVVPSPTGTSRLDRRGQRWMFVKGRLKPGATVPQAGANLDVLMRQLAAAHPQTNKDRRAAVKASSDVRLHPDGDQLILFIGVGLMVAVGLVLLIACANVASMLLARASARQREIAIRLAIGAGRGRLIRQLVTESLVLASAGAAAGILVAAWSIRLIATPTLPVPIPVVLDLRMDLRVLFFTLLVTTIAGTVAGLMPALKASRPNLVDALRSAPAPPRVGGRWTLRDALVAGQMATTAVLLVTAGLLARSVLASRSADVGFRADGLAIVSADLGLARYDAPRAEQFWRRALERVSALPGVESAALAARLPFSINFNVEQFHIPGHASPNALGFSIQNTRVSADYFRALGVPIVEGRGFTSADTPQSPTVVVINETMARRFWKDRSALGQRIHLRTADGPVFEIVGVAADHHVRTVGESPQPYVHFAVSQRMDTYQVLMARTRGDAGRLVEEIRRELTSLEPNAPMLDSQTMEAQIAATLLPVRVGMWVVSAVGGVALLLAAVGLYGVIAYSVSRRTREIGIRVALGARPGTVVSLVLRQGLLVAAAGLAIGGLLAIVATRALAGMLYRVSLADPIAWSGAAAAILGAAVVANLLPARRAARVDPAVALRSE
ncbi:MAG TPA: ABC transporter permease [Vicinamibacterales bacterium]|jgi:predicted permease|nr:ABC transporter permease [Vicinamibacterales bacterium]